VVGVGYDESADFRRAGAGRCAKPWHCRRDGRKGEFLLPWPFEVTGSTELSLGTRSAAAAFDGTFSFCPAEAAVSYETPYRYPVQPTTCRSANHWLAWMRH